MVMGVSSRVSAYLVLVATGLLGALLLGRPEPALVVLPFAIILVLGLALVERPQLEVELELDSDRIVESEDLRVLVTVRSAGAIHRLDIELALPQSIAGVPPGGYVARMRSGEQRVFEWHLRCRRWGAFRLGELSLRSRDRFGLFSFDERCDRRLPIKVFPSYERLRKALRPARTQAFSGDFVSRFKGEGIEFADIRQFAPGDRVRQINWRVSARSGQLAVNQMHPERNTDVVIFVDAFTDLRGPNRSSLDLAVKGAAGLADHYLARRDRVGLIAFGGTLRWLRPSMGAEHLYRLVDSLLDTEVVLSYAWKGIEVIPRRMLPANALVVAFTPLVDERSVAGLLDLRGRGHDLTVVELSAAAFTSPGPTEADRIAYRLWEMERQALRSRYQALGAPIVLWDPSQPFQAAVEEVSGFRRYARLARA